jgi:xylulokinase
VITALGVEVESIRLSGGGARSGTWRQMFADIFAKRVVTLESQEGSAYGSALLAMTGTGAFASVPEACKAVIREVESIQPRADESERYARSHEIYQSLYPALQPFYGQFR